MNTDYKLPEKGTKEYLRRKNKFENLKNNKKSLAKKKSTRKDKKEGGFFFFFWF